MTNLTCLHLSSVASYFVTHNNFHHFLETTVLIGLASLNTNYLMEISQSKKSKLYVLTERHVNTLTLFLPGMGEFLL